MYDQILDLIEQLKTSNIDFDSFINDVNNIFSKNKKINEQEKIVVTMLENNYEAVLNTGFMRELRKCYPSAHITLVVKDDIYLINNKYVDEIVFALINEINILNTMTSSISVIKEHKLDNVDKAFSLSWPSNTTTLFFNWLLSAKERIGYPMSVYNLYNEKKIESQFDVLLNKQIINPIEINNEVLRKFYILEKLGFNINDKSLEPIDKENIDDESIVLIDISYFQPNWSFSLKKYAEVILTKFNDGQKIMIRSNNENDKKYLISLLTEDKYNNFEKKIDKNNIIDYDLAKIPQVLIYIGNNTEIMQLVSAYNKPVVGLFAEAEDKDSDNSIYNRFHPLSTKSIILRPEYSIDNCSAMEFYGGCHYPYPHCINEITVEQIMEAIDELI